MSQTYRHRADECRTMAAKTSDPAEKTAWLKLADDWTNLAREVDRVFRMPSMQDDEAAEAPLREDTHRAPSPAP